jgi:hypothetical protein
MSGSAVEVYRTPLATDAPLARKAREDGQAASAPTGRGFRDARKSPKLLSEKRFLFLKPHLIIPLKRVRNTAILSDTCP